MKKNIIGLIMGIVLAALTIFLLFLNNDPLSRLAPLTLIIGLALIGYNSLLLRYARY